MKLCQSTFKNPRKRIFQARDCNASISPLPLLLFCTICSELWYQREQRSQSFKVPTALSNSPDFRRRFPRVCLLSWQLLIAQPLRLSAPILLTSDLFHRSLITHAHLSSLYTKAHSEDGDFDTSLRIHLIIPSSQHFCCPQYHHPAGQTPDFLLSFKIGDWLHFS